MTVTNPPERIVTDHLAGIRIDPSHLGFFLDLWQDPEVTATLGGSKAPGQIEATLDSLLSHWDVHGFGVWLLSLHDDLDGVQLGDVVGYGGLRRGTVEGTPETEILYGFVPAAWGRGYATELARASVAVAFDDAGLEDVVSFTLPDNRASQRVMQKAGLTYERNITHAGLAHVLYRRRRSAPAEMP